MLGALAAIVPAYLWFGRKAVIVLMNHRAATPDTLYGPFAHSFVHPGSPEVAGVIVPCCVILAILLMWRMPAAHPRAEPGLAARPAVPAPVV